MKKISNMKYRVDIGFIGDDRARDAYGGKINAWSFQDIDPILWFHNFRDRIIESIGKNYLPIYRMADGEYRFLIGRKFCFNKKYTFRELISLLAERVHIKNSKKWKTSWGESYSLDQVLDIKLKLVEDIKYIAKFGYLGCYLNDNGLNAYIDHNEHVEKYFIENNINFDISNYVPFHFVVGLLVNNGWEEFFINRKILIVTGMDSKKGDLISTNVRNLGAKEVILYSISSYSSMTDILDINKLTGIGIDLCLVAAGIGAANILRQLEPLKTVALDIGGYMNCFENPSLSQHGGTFFYPGIFK